jgi:hypothetical protein
MVFAGKHSPRPDSHSTIPHISVSRACRLPAEKIQAPHRQKAVARQETIRGNRTMNRTLTNLAAGVGFFVGLAASAQAATDMSLARLDCGTPQAPTAVNQRFSDTFAFGDLKVQFIFSCYLIKHGDEYMLWDTGHAMTAANVAP